MYVHVLFVFIITSLSCISPIVADESTNTPTTSGYVTDEYALNLTSTVSSTQDSGNYETHNKHLDINDDHKPDTDKTGIEQTLMQIEIEPDNLLFEEKQDDIDQDITISIKDQLINQSTEQSFTDNDFYGHKITDFTHFDDNSLSTASSDAPDIVCIYDRTTFALTGLHYLIHEDTVEIIWNDIDEINSACKVNYTIQVPEFNITSYVNGTHYEVTPFVCKDFHVIVEGRNHYNVTSDQITVNIVLEKFDYELISDATAFEIKFSRQNTLSVCDIKYNVTIEEFVETDKTEEQSVVYNDYVIDYLTFNETVPCGKYAITAAMVIGNSVSNAITKHIIIDSSVPPSFDITVTDVAKTVANFSVDLENVKYFCELFMKVECTPDLTLEAQTNFTIQKPYKYQLINLTPFHSYNCSGILYHSDYESFPVIFAINTQEDKPSDPTNVRIESVTATNINISWNEPTHLPGILREYKLVIIGTPQYDPPDICEIQYINRTKATTDLYFVFDDLEPNHEYFITIQAKTKEYGPGVTVNATTLIPRPNSPISKYSLSNRGPNEPVAYFTWLYPCDIFVSPQYVQFTFEVFAENIRETHTVNVDKNIENLQFDLLLKPGKNYTVYMITSNKQENLKSDPSIYNIYTPPPETSEPRNVTVNETTDKQILISWTEPNIIYGTILYYELFITGNSLHNNIIVDYCNSSNITLPTNVTTTNYQFNYAIPHYHFEITIALVTSELTGQNTTSWYDTRPEISQPIMNLSCTIIENSIIDTYNVTAQIEIQPPCEFNGNFDHYLISMTDEQGLSEEIQDEHDLQYTFYLRPDTEYYIDAKVVNEVGSSNTTQCKFSSPAGIPLQPDLKPEMVVKTTFIKSAEILLADNYFDANNGIIKYYALLIAESKNWNNEGDAGVWDNEEWGFVDYWNSDGDLYQATPAWWNPFNDFNNNFTYVIGTENCTSVKDQFCNGYLKPLTEYVLIIRGFTKNTYRDSTPIVFVTLSDLEKTEVVTVIVATLSSILAVGIVIGIGYLYWRRRNKKIIESDPPQSCMDEERYIFPRCVNAKDFPSHFNKCMENSFLLEDEYAMLTKIGENLECSVAELPENKKKNRYINILPYDCTRVPLQCEDDDYINASYIKGYSGKIEYIATQGPLESTTYDFWRMVVQEECSVVAMVAQFKEQNKVKCHRYFPENREQLELEYNGKSDMTIRCSYELNFDFYMERQIVIQTKEKQHVVTHLQFLNWPDFGCPDGTTNMLQYTLILRKHMQENNNKAVIHCSAGVGRTGTIIAVDILLQAINNDEDINVFSTVSDLRRQRTRMVQAQSQYVYIYKCINDAIVIPLKLTQIKAVDPIYENLENVMEMKEFKMSNNNVNKLQDKDALSNNNETFQNMVNKQTTEVPLNEPPNESTSNDSSSRLI